MLRDAYIFKPDNNMVGNKKWEYPLKKQIPSCYDYRSAQSLLEFDYRITIHNRQVDDNVTNPLSLNPPRFDVVIPLYTRILDKKVNVLWFFYSSCMDIAVVSFTATYNETLWEIDFDYPQVAPLTVNNYVRGMMMHGGFWKLYSRIQDDLINLLNTYVKKRTQVISTGWSLGGATSTIGAIDMYRRKLKSGYIIKNLVHYSFASPRLFNTLGAERYDCLHIKSHRIVNGSDIVPVVPLPIMPVSFNPLVTEDFTHVNGLIYFDMNLGTYYDNHVIAYLNYYKVTYIPP